MSKKHIEALNIQKLNLTISISFFIALEAALLAYINSSFLKQFIAIENIGYIFIITNIITAIIILLLTNLISKFGRYKIFLVFFIIHFFSLIGLSLAENSLLAISSFILWNMSLFIIYIGIDVFSETFSCDLKTGQIKGKQLTITNLAWVVAPIISGYLIAVYNFSLLFAIATIITFIGLSIFINLKGKYKQDNNKFNLKKSFYKAIKNKNLSNIMLVQLFLNMFFAGMVIYMPLYLLQLGLEWSQIGIIFTIMLTPFIIFQYPAGWLADNKCGEKEIMMMGFIIISISTCLIFFININTIWVWAVILFLNRIGACLVQVMSESYFYKQIDCRDVDLINFFRLMRSGGYIVMTILASIILVFYPISYIFLFLGIFMLFGLILTKQIKDTK